MTKILLALVAALALLSGCSPVKEAAAPAPTVTVTQSTPDVAASTVADDSATLTDDEKFDMMLPDIADERPTATELVELRNLAHITCDSIDDGVGKMTVIELMIGQGIEPDSRVGRLTMAAMVVGVEVYCPEHRGFFEG